MTTTSRSCSSPYNKRTAGCGMGPHTTEHCCKPIRCPNPQVAGGGARASAECRLSSPLLSYSPLLVPRSRSSWHAFYGCTLLRAAVTSTFLHYFCCLTHKSHSHSRRIHSGFIGRIYTNTRAYTVFVLVCKIPTAVYCSLTYCK